MELGTREHEGASLELSQSKELPENLSAIIEVSKLQTPKLQRRKGLATDLLMQVCDEADAEGIVLMLMPDGEEWLQGFYGRFGFATIQTEPVVLMARPPNLNAAKRQEHNERSIIH